MSNSVILPNGTSAEQCIDPIHQMIHEGRVFCAFLTGTLGSGEVAQIALTVPSTGAHAVVHAMSEKIAGLVVLEDVSSLAVAAGAAFTAKNRNRNSSRAAGVTVLTGVTGANITYSGGTTIDSEQLTTAGKGGSLDYTHEIILKASASTVFKLTAGAASCNFGLKVTWYEPSR